MNGQNRSDIKPGMEVDIVLKADQPTGKLTRGIVQDILTNSSEHHRGIKVRLTSGQVGRVQNVVSPMLQKQTKTLRVDIWVDIVCPFCYIGEHQFFKALEKFEHRSAVRVALHSYELNPGAPSETHESLHEYLAKRKGISVSDALEMNKNVTEYAKSVGLMFNLNIAKPVNSFDAHRLFHLSKKYKLQGKMMDRLHAAYFSEGKNIADRETLKQLAKDVGVDADAVEKMFTTSDYTDEVRADEDAAKQIGATGVPFFLFNNKYTVTGAQQSENFLHALISVWNNP